ncbi:MAG: mechanosensitive ion channel family protein [Proteobacteria bacterium]|nr:mechanosensitive ion channel family protein [Pseudomonadota bacterium]
MIALSKAIKAEEFDRAMNYLDLRNLSFDIDKEIDGSELIRKLVIVARRAMDIDVGALSDSPMGNKDDGLPSYRDRITTIKTKEGNIDILMQRIPRGDGVYIWKISNATISLIPELNEEFGYGPVGEKLSLFFPPYVTAGFELWQLVMLSGILLLAYIFSFVVTTILLKISQRNDRFNKKRLQKFFTGSLRFLIIVIIYRLTFDLISPSIIAKSFFEAKTFVILSLLWLSQSFVELIVYRLADRMKRNGQTDAVLILKPASTAAKWLLVLFAILSWMDNLGYEVTTILAGLGIGGVALALAAKKSLEDLIGSITIYISQPVKVGDTCQFGKFFGTVEEIGLRSTQIRTLARTVVHVPNALFASAEIENLTQRDKILYRTRLRLSYEEIPAKIRQVLKAIRDLIDNHENIDEENSRVRFIEFGEYAQEIELYVYLKTRDFSEYLAFREDVNLRISETVEAAGVKLVIPARTVYVNELPVTQSG